MCLHSKASEISHSESNGLDMFHQGSNMDRTLWSLKFSTSNEK